ncbi:MAG: hypothetical protein HYX76_05540 [Acidobacteria bacterium]|nr:hypothetical protein [Acidobacteriota bacterium]
MTLSGSAVEQLDLQEVLFRASEYLVAYQKSFASIVAEERYAQRIISRTGAQKRSRVTLSDFLLVRVPEDDTWIGFRDVFDVDGSPVRNRQERLARLFLSAPGALSQIKKIADESARYNLGSIRRNINVPTTALMFLHPVNQSRFYFEKSGEEVVDGNSTWAIAYTEHVRPTMIRAGTLDLFSRGTFWIDPANGRIVRSLLVIGDMNTPVRTEIVTTYRPDTTLGVWIPATMREVYDNPRDPRADRIEADAMYSKFRRFEVKVDEKIQLPK